MTPPPRGYGSSSDLRRLLLDAAHEILSEPETALELREVARRADKSRTAPYLVFGKESEGGGLLGLKIAVAAEGARDMADRMEAAAATGSAALEAFHAVALAFLKFVGEHRRLFRLMYGPDIAALPAVGEDGFRTHPEFRALLEHRTRAGNVISRLIERGQRRGQLPRDPLALVRDGGGTDLDRPSARLLQIAWATMIGVALLRDDELLRSIGWDITLDQGARLVVESVFGLDPLDDTAAARSFLEAVEEEAEEEAEEDFEEGFISFAMPMSDAEIWVADEKWDDEPDQEPEFEPDEWHADAADVGDEATPPPAAARGLPLFEGEAPLPAPRQLEFPLSETLERHSGLQRAARSRTVLSRARVLWIDDHPEWIRKGVETLEHLGATVTLATTTAAAKRTLRAAPSPGGPPFDVIVSDIARGSRPDAGVRALPELRALAPDVPVIFFVGDVDRSLGVPRGAAGITNRTNELLHLVLDALEGR